MPRDYRWCNECSCISEVYRKKCISDLKSSSPIFMIAVIWLPLMRWMLFSTDVKLLSPGEIFVSRADELAVTVNIVQSSGCRRSRSFLTRWKYFTAGDDFAQDIDVIRHQFLVLADLSVVLLFLLLVYLWRILFAVHVWSWRSHHWQMSIDADE